MLAKLASKLDKLGSYEKADKITNSLIKLSKEELPFDITEGATYNDPDTVMKYFMGYAFDMFSKDKNISKKRIEMEVKKKVEEKLQEMNSDDKEKYRNFDSEVMKNLETQTWYKNLPETQEFDQESDSIRFDPNSTGFKNAIKYILNVEGGYSDYNSSTGDPRTNLGIIQSEYDDYRSEKGLEKQSVRNITVDEAEEIYFDNYWTPTKSEIIYKNYPKTALAIFDFAVNSGLSGASSLVAKTLDIPNTKFDNNMVNSIIMAAGTMGDSQLFSNLIQRRRVNYQDIIKRRPNKSVYGPGWQNRLDKLENFTQDDN